jgi:hypothetical protein
MKFSAVWRYELEDHLVALLEQLGESSHTEEAQNALRAAIRDLPRLRDSSTSAYIIRFKLWIRRYHPEQLGDPTVVQDASDVETLASLSAEIRRVVNAIDSSFGLGRIFYFSAPALGLAADIYVVGLVVDFIVAVAAGLASVRLESLRGKLPSRRSIRIYSEPELIEQAQRILAIRASVSFDHLILKAIESNGVAEGTADFSVEGGDLYSISIKMIRGIAVVKKLRREVQSAA